MNFFQSEIKVLGHIVSSTGIHTDPEKTKAVQIRNKWKASSGCAHIIVVL